MASGSPNQTARENAEEIGIFSSVFGWLVGRGGLWATQIDAKMRTRKFAKPKKPVG